MTYKLKRTIIIDETHQKLIFTDGTNDYSADLKLETGGVFVVCDGYTYAYDNWNKAVSGTLSDLNHPHIPQTPEQIGLTPVMTGIDKIKQQIREKSDDEILAALMLLKEQEDTEGARMVRACLLDVYQERNGEAATLELESTIEAMTEEVVINVTVRNSDGEVIGECGIEQCTDPDEKLLSMGYVLDYFRREGYENPSLAYSVVSK